MTNQPNDIALVVDDSADALSLINDTLETANIDVLVALEGKQALTIAKKIRPDIILLDALMPVMDGFETCKKLKEDISLASIPVIFMTGLTDTDSIVKGLEVGGVDYLIKPIQPDELLARIKVHLKNARLTNHAHSALDTAGQHLLTITPNGDIQWATPQTHALLAKANASEIWQTTLAQQLAQWLQQQPEQNQTLALDVPTYPLSVKFIGHQQDGMLLKLLDGKKPTGAKLLQTALNLTEREAEVLHWVANGKSNRDIAEILTMSPRTVNKHLEQIFPKLGVENRTAAAAIALKVASSFE